MDKYMYQMAAGTCSEVYKNNPAIQDLGTTEFMLSNGSWTGRPVQILAIAGTNEIKDWRINLNLFSQQGIKIGAFKAAHEIHSKFKRDKDVPLLVCGHSKAGATAIAYKRLFDADYCIAFAPARCLRYWADREMENTTIFIDPDDPVSTLGFLSFGHPQCDRIYAKNDHLGLSVKDHFMDNWVQFCGNL